jgi:DNA-binding transcriptional MocR family regulator
MIEGGGNSLRIAYSAVPPDQIEEGIGRIAEAYRELEAPARA